MYLHTMCVCVVCVMERGSYITYPGKYHPPFSFLLPISHISFLDEIGVLFPGYLLYSQEAVGGGGKNTRNPTDGPVPPLT